MVTKKLKYNGNYDVDKVIRNILSNLTSEHYKKVIAAKDGNVTIYIYEKYYFRTNSDLTVTAIVRYEDLTTYVDIIVGGGSIGLISLDYGSENNALNELYNKLVSVGFKEF